MVVGDGLKERLRERSWEMVSVLEGGSESWALGCYVLVRGVDVEMRVGAASSGAGVEAKPLVERDKDVQDCAADPCGRSECEEQNRRTTQHTFSQYISILRSDSPVETQYGFTSH